MGSWFSREDQPQPTLSINHLSDIELQSIFKHLPPFDRLIISEVSQRWYGISRIPWRDVVSIDLTPIPGENLAAIIRQCPNLRSVVAFRAKLDCKTLHLLSRVPLLFSIKFYNSSVSIPVLGIENGDLFTALFSEDRLNTSWQELVLHEVCADVSAAYQNGFLAGALPPTLERLQLSGLRANGPSALWNFFSSPYSGREFLTGLGRLQNLTCLILYGTHSICLMDIALIQPQTYRELEKLKNLRELCIGCYDIDDSFEVDIGALPFLPKLQVLFLFNVWNNSEEDLTRLATTHPSLRILMITGCFDHERTIPVRRVFGSDPLPLLHIFLGKRPSEKIRFTKSSPLALKVYPISKPLPTFLESEEIAPIFDGVWIAAQIKEGAKHGAKLCYCGCPPATSIRFVGDE